MHSSARARSACPTGDDSPSSSQADEFSSSSAAAASFPSPQNKTLEVLFYFTVGEVANLCKGE
jgi:hypothetical protein